MVPICPCTHRVLNIAEKNSGPRLGRARVWTRLGSGLNSIGPGSGPDWARFWTRSGPGRAQTHFFHFSRVRAGPGLKFLFFSGPGPKKRVPAAPYQKQINVIFMNIISVSTIWPNQIRYKTTAICSQQHWSLPQWSSNSIWEKKLCKRNISWSRAGSGWAKVETGRAGPRNTEASFGRAGPLFCDPFRALVYTPKDKKFLIFFQQK